MALKYHEFTSGLRWTVGITLTRPKAIAYILKLKVNHRAWKSGMLGKVICSCTFCIVCLREKGTRALFLVNIFTIWCMHNIKKRWKRFVWLGNKKGRYHIFSHITRIPPPPRNGCWNACFK